MHRNLWFILSLLVLASCGNVSTTETTKVSEPKIVARYLSTSAYPAKKMTEDKKGFVLGERMKDGKGKYTFTFYSDSIVLTTDRKTKFDIDSIDTRYSPDNLGYFVRNINGERYLIAVSGISRNDNIHVDFYEEIGRAHV